MLGTQQLVETAYELVSRSDAETLRVLRDDIILLVNANPDGEELTANWYMREADPAKRTVDGLPRLYQKLHRTRRQPRFLHVDAGGNDQHEPDPLQGMVPANRL